MNEIQVQETTWMNLIMLEPRNKTQKNTYIQDDSIYPKFKNKQQ